jgi:hypothetical protein
MTTFNSSIDSRNQEKTFREADHIERQESYPGKAGMIRLRERERATIGIP